MLTNKTLRRNLISNPDFYYINEPEKEERRCFRRFKCKKKIMAFFGTDYGMLRDISLGGLSFLSLIKKDTDAPFEINKGEKIRIDLILGQEEIMAPDLYSEVVYNHRIPVSMTGVRQCFHRNLYGLRFKDLSTRQVFLVKSIILRGTYL